MPQSLWSSAQTSIHLFQDLVFSLLETMIDPSGVILEGSMTLSDKPGPSLIKITHLECTLGRREERDRKRGQIILILFL